MKTILAVGADVKNRFLVAEGRNFHFGPSIGDLSEAQNFELFKKKIKKAIKRKKPDVVACDLHPGYFSAKFVKIYNPKPVQHHHAHIASVMQEHGLRKPVIGVSFDGTGLGTDGNIWGGEFLLVGRKGFRRPAHFKYAKMPGGEKAVREPWRMALSILGRIGFPYVKGIKRRDKEAILSIMERNINSPLTSSAGRLFDAAAALAGICQIASYEAEGPVRLEKMCENRIEESYKFDVLKDGGGYIIDMKIAFLGIVRDLKKKRNRRFIATKFHNTMVNVIIDMVKKISEESRTKDVALSGGVFQNEFLREKAVNKLSSAGFNVYMNRRVPVNDLNISLGQYYVSCGTGKN